MFTYMIEDAKGKRIDTMTVADEASVDEVLAIVSQKTSIPLASFGEVIGHGGYLRLEDKNGNVLVHLILEN